MKRLLWAIALLLPVLTGCMVVDWYPVNLEFYVQDADGNDLLDPSSDTYIGDKISVTFDGVEYVYTPKTKMYLPYFSGLDIKLNTVTGRYYAFFGELDGAVDRSDDYVVQFPDGSSRKIHYKRKVNQITISARQHWYLDGKIVEYPISIEY